jgi:hypothetical protein
MIADSPKKAESQIKKFRDAARELETDDSEEAFDKKLKKVASAGQHKPEKSGTTKKSG